MRLFNRRSNSGTTVNESNALIQTGWAYVTVAPGTNNGSVNITFPTAYTTAPIFLLGNSTYSTTLPTSNTSSSGVLGSGVATSWTSLTTTGVSVAFYNTTNVGATTYFVVQWVAIGV